MAIGWKKVNDKWYYLADNGEMKTGIIQIEGTYYALKNNGEMLENTNIEIDSDGALQL
ncbi:hypothetical protein [Bacillus sp. HNG]|uniref:hypothetical protein n=1 Tax=Bacillus sp. HNG TaxID=2293325 RepID=UPI0039836C2B